MLGGEAKTASGHWAFNPPAVREVPSISNSAWVQNPIDAFIGSSLGAKNLAPASRIEKRGLIRRATYDLTGLPPTFEEVESFLSDNSPSAYAALVERLLGSKAYGEQWGRHWLDVVRYADTAGETADYPVPVAWRYRNYVINSFNRDKPYNEFIREQIAGDILARKGPRELYAERVVATGFLALSRRFGFDSENYHHLTIQDTIDTLGQAFLGLSLGCARCHDHKYDPIPTNDYYALYGIFESTRYAFPGSEQKQKYRALVPLAPPEESQPQWRQFQERAASLMEKLEAEKQPFPSAVLRSLDDIDGDFEMQAPAAGGSNGVLVPPWFYEGKIAVNREAQSPFKNVSAAGKVGVSLPSNSHCALWQALRPRRISENGSQLHVNFDFRVGANQSEHEGSRRFWIGSRTREMGHEGELWKNRPALELLISSKAIKIRAADSEKTIRPLKPGEWQNVQLMVDLDSKRVRGSVGAPGNLVEFAAPLSEEWNQVIDFLQIDTMASAESTVPQFELDNIALQETAIRPVSTSLPPLAVGEQSITRLKDDLRKLTGIDGDFEFQTVEAPPTSPWNPGPNSVVKVSTTAQSPFQNVYPLGELGVHMPNRGAYDGFGQALNQTWKQDQTEKLYVGFDIRCANQNAGGNGSWRYYIGHGAGASAAVELFFNGGSFFARNGDARAPICPAKIGEWFQVQLTLNLKEKSYSGTITSRASHAEFAGKFAPGWDGVVDHTFIDSYGHIGGVRPALDADNFAVSEAPLPPFDAPPLRLSHAEIDSKRSQAQKLHKALAEIQSRSEQDRKELERMLVNGPMDLAYGVVEGTPHDAFMQLRGDPEKPGPRVPRGFLSALGGGKLPADLSGSGRLELANWVASPENPLTARVMVNRIWEYHFGRGLVATPNDFGKRGQPPTHPELLDYLAAKFIESGWSIKAMHRLIMSSATYQQSSISGSPIAKGLYQGFERRRLSAEELRDSILFASQELDPLPGKEHPFTSPTTWGYTQHSPFNAVYDHNKRSVYLMTQRIKRHPFLALFDGPDPNASVPDRRMTTVPTQALFFLNDPFVHRQADKLASLAQHVSADDRQRIEFVWQRALSRTPSEMEAIEALAFLESYGAELRAVHSENPDAVALAAYARTLFGSNEFLHID